MIHLNISQSEGAQYYAALNLLAILLGIAVTAWHARKSSFQFRELAVIAASGILCLLIGSKVVLFHNSDWQALFRNGVLPIDLGKSMVGAIAGGMFGIWFSAKLLGKKESILDLCALAFPVSLGVARIGCLISGCCHGHITSSSLSISYGPGSKIYNEQLEAGLLQADSVSSLGVYPQQLFSVLACMFIAFLVWRTGPVWKAPSGKFIFSVLLCLVFRFLEDFGRFYIDPKIWMGLQVIQWKVLLLFIALLIIFIVRERSHTLNVNANKVTGLNSDGNIRLLVISVFVLIMASQIGGWFSDDERLILLITVFPLCALATADAFIRLLSKNQFLRPASLVLVALVFMSQKADVPETIPKSYTSFNLSTGAGQFNHDHQFNSEYANLTDCEGNNFRSVVSDDVEYKQVYKIVGAGISRKVYYKQWQSLLMQMNVYGGTQTQTPVPNSNLTFEPPSFKNTLWGINPMLHYDARAFGLGVGASFGILGNDIDDSENNLKDYEPKLDARKASLQYRMRFFSERYAFLEMLGGYDLGSVGEYNWQVLLGSRFNSDKLMLKAGVSNSITDGQAVVMHGEIRLAPRFYISPQLMINFANNDYQYNRGGYRTALGISYRINDR